MATATVLLLVKRAPTQKGYGLVKTMKAASQSKTEDQLYERLLSEARSAARTWWRNYPSWQFRIVDAREYQNYNWRTPKYAAYAYYEDVQPLYSSKQEDLSNA